MLAALRRTTVRTVRAGLVVVLGAGLGASAASAQVIRGVLVDDATSQPIPGALILLIDEDGEEVRRTFGDSIGVFHLRADLGQWQLEAQRIGYQTTRSLAFDMQTLDTLDVQFHIDADVVLIAPIMVSVGTPPGRELFDIRSRLGEGFHYSPALIDSIRPEKYVADIFRARDRRTWTRWTAGLKEDNSYGPLPRIVSWLGTGCLVFVVDDIPVAPPFLGRSYWGVSPLSELTPEDLVAVEVYRAAHELPDGFHKTLRARNAWEARTLRTIQQRACGVVVFWTTRGW